MLKDNILKTKSIGENLISGSYHDSKFNEYLDALNSIVESFNSLEIESSVIARTIELIKNSSPEDFRLGIFMKIYYALMAPRLTGGILMLKNSKEHIQMRFIIDTNSKLSLLLSAEGLENTTI